MQLLFQISRLLGSLSFGKSYFYNRFGRKQDKRSKEVNQSHQLLICYVDHQFQLKKHQKGLMICYDDIVSTFSQHLTLFLLSTVLST
ncbi:Uncharacterized protein TCM_033576 [Theobroma cacao]|uniref:Uncharacterized protein n=1 Tax=Theobroma cacao TaxID=3641 RepID=A0A061FAA7_THECC|nr:Uncharacterized protein TCM_033576 [Theobroma cacao]